MRRHYFSFLRDLFSPLGPTLCILTLPQRGHTHLRLLWKERFSSFIPILHLGQSIKNPMGSKLCLGVK